MTIDSNPGKESNPPARHWINHLNPAIPKRWLLVLAGIMWFGVGILLCSLAITWLIKSPNLISLLLAILGIIITIFINILMFSPLALKNVKRILAAREKACLFSFQAWTGYLIIAIMMTIGIFLRNSSIPKPYLAVVYLSIGGALLQASFHYFKNFILFNR